MATIGRPPSGGTGGGSGWIRVGDITGQGIVSITEKVYQDDPNDTILQTCQASGSAIRVLVRSSSAKITIEGVEYLLLPSTDGGHYEAILNVSFSGGTLHVIAVTPNDSVGEQVTLEIEVVLPAELTSFVFSGPYPTNALQLQDEVKAGDTFNLDWSSDGLIDAIEIQNVGASASTQLLTFTAATSGNVTMEVGDRGDSPTLYPATGRPRDDSSGAFGADRLTNTGGDSVDGVNLIKLNNKVPGITAIDGAIDYPGVQQALKGIQSATVPNEVTDADFVTYSSPTGELTITNPNTIEDLKEVTRLSGSYNITTSNFKIAAMRGANGQTAEDEGVVFIAAVAAIITVVPPAARLRSGGNDGTSPQDHEIQIQANQQLSLTPTLDEGSGNAGTWQGGGFTGGPTVWSRDLQVLDDDDKGVKTFTNLIASNLSGMLTVIIDSGEDYVLGGFVARDLTFPSVSPIAALNVAVSDYGKLQAGIFTATNQPAVRHTPQGDQGDAANEYTILDPLGDNPQDLWWNDEEKVGTNISGTAQILDVKEVV